MPERRQNGTDRFRDELASLMRRYAGDYTLPALTTAIVHTARNMQIPLDAVVDSMRVGWQMLDDFEARAGGGQ